MLIAVMRHAGRLHIVSSGTPSHAPIDKAGLHRPLGMTECANPFVAGATCCVPFDGIIEVSTDMDSGNPAPRTPVIVQLITVADADLILPSRLVKLVAEAIDSNPSTPCALWLSVLPTDLTQLNEVVSSKICQWMMGYQNDSRISWPFHPLS